jgi:CubicO group peptidase (beta-lactamase class C family)
MRESLNAAIHGVLEAAVSGGGLPGAVAIVVDRDGPRGVASAGSTRADGTGEPLGRDARFRIASMTKAFTSVAALQLIEQGKLGLDDPVASVVPAWKELQVLDGWDGDQPRLREPKTEATIRHLLTHTAGHGYLFFSADLGRYHDVTGTPHVFVGPRSALTTPLLTEPGTRWEYGINTDWLGLAVEEVSGQMLDAYLADHLFNPLGMADTTFTPTADQRAAMMPVHSRTADGGLVVSDIDLPVAPEWMAGGHGAFSTADDYGRFVTMLLGDGSAADGGRVLEAETIELAFSNQLGGITYPDVIETAVPELTNTVYNLPVGHGWGLGFHLTLDDLEGMRRAGTGDWAGIFNCYYWVDRASGIGGVFLTQVLPFFDQSCVEAAVGVELAAYADAA